MPLQDNSGVLFRGLKVRMAMASGIAVVDLANAKPEEQQHMLPGHLPVSTASVVCSMDLYEQLNLKRAWRERRGWQMSMVKLSEAIKWGMVEQGMAGEISLTCHMIFGCWRVIWV